MLGKATSLDRNTIGFTNVMASFSVAFFASNFFVGSKWAKGGAAHRARIHVPLDCVRSLRDICLLSVWVLLGSFPLWQPSAGAAGSQRLKAPKNNTVHAAKPHLRIMYLRPSDQEICCATITTALLLVECVAIQTTFNIHCYVVLRLQLFRIPKANLGSN